MDWAFNSRGDTDVFRHFLQSMTDCAGQAELCGGVPVGSVCTGWGVAEMVIAELNEKMAGYFPNLPEAC